MKLLTSLFRGTNNAASQLDKDAELSTNAKNIAAKVTSFVCADAHFITKSVADGIVKLEASIVNKLTGQSKDEITEDRHNKTEECQEEWLTMGKYIHDEVRRGARTIITKSGKLTRIDPTVVVSQTETFVNND